MVNMDGVNLASAYAFPPNRKGYCGISGYAKLLKAYRAGEADSDSLRRGLMRFSAHYAYLSLIARENGLDPFDNEVVRAFWTGNRLLESVSPKAMRSFIRNGLLKGKSPSRAKRLCDGLPDGILPHHSFNVLYVNFVSNSVPRTIRNFDSCCITSGKVLSVSGNTATLLRRAISYSRGFAVKETVSRVSLVRGGMRFIKSLEKGDTVSVHWGMAIEKLNPRDARLLESYNNKNIIAVNNGQASKKESMRRLTE